MAWIESHQTLAHHPKTLALAAALHTSKPAALGHLHLLWWWTLDYAPDGDLSRFDDRTLAEAAEWRKGPDLLVSALRVSGWLDGDGHVHDWYDYAGRLVQQRAANRDRMRQARAVTVRARAAHVPDNVRATEPDLTVPSTSPLPPAERGVPNGSPRIRGTNPRAYNPPVRIEPTLYYRGACPDCHMEINQRGTSGPFIGHAEDCTRTAAHAAEGGKA